MADHRPCIDYEKIMREQATGVVARALSQTAESGLPGDHHFLITFATRHKDVKIPAWLRIKYPQVMTLMIQHQFWDLQVTTGEFSIALAFGGKRESLVVPFDAMLQFSDPSVGIILQFDPSPHNEASENMQPTEDVTTPDSEAPEGRVIRVDFGKKK